jgi:hypothetical protein
MGRSRAKCNRSTINGHADSGAIPIKENVMSKRFPRSFILATVLCVTGCANMQQGMLPQNDSALDTKIDEALEKFCPISDPTVGDRLVRARFVLAAASGYSYRSIQNYSSKTEIEEDAWRTLNRIKPAFEAIQAADAHKDKYLFPVYRADMLIEIAEVADAAIQPTVRAGRALITASNIDRLSRLKTMLFGLLKDELYLEAYKNSCIKYTAAKNEASGKSEGNDRIKQRCVDLATFAKKEVKECDFVK